MRYHVTVSDSTGERYEFILSDPVAKDFKDFINGVHKEQFFTIVAGKNFVMLSRKYIAHVLFEVEGGN